MRCVRSRDLASCTRYSPEQLFTVVADVEHYHEFVPWCQRSEVLVRRDMEYVEAELEVGFKLFVERCAGTHVAWYSSAVSCKGRERSGLWVLHQEGCSCLCASIL